MQTTYMVPAREFCHHHNIELSFIHSLHQFGLVTIVSVGEDLFLQGNELDELEKIVRLHFDLDVNLEGIDVINHLLQRMKEMQQTIAELNRRLDANIEHS